MVHISSARRKESRLEDPPPTPPCREGSKKLRNSIASRPVHNSPHSVLFSPSLQGGGWGVGLFLNLTCPSRSTSEQDPAPEASHVPPLRFVWCFATGSAHTLRAHSSSRSARLHSPFRAIRSRFR